MMSKRSSNKKEAKKNEELEAVVFNFKNFNKTLNNFLKKKAKKFKCKRARHFKKKKKRGKTSPTRVVGVRWKSVRNNNNNKKYIFSVFSSSSSLEAFLSLSSVRDKRGAERYVFVFEG